MTNTTTTKEQIMTIEATYLIYSTYLAHDAGWDERQSEWSVAHLTPGAVDVPAADRARYRTTNTGDVIFERDTCGPECAGHGREHTETDVLGEAGMIDEIWAIVRADAEARLGIELDPENWHGR